MKEMVGDNFTFELNGVPVSTAVDVGTLSHNFAVGWKQEEKKLILFWTTTSVKDINLFPAPLGRDDLIAMVTAWLKDVDYGPEPDHDGHNGKTCRAYADKWGYVDGHGWQSIMAIEPFWATYGK